MQLSNCINIWFGSLTLFLHQIFLFLGEKVVLLERLENGECMVRLCLWMDGWFEGNITHSGGCGLTKEQTMFKWSNQRTTIREPWIKVREAASEEKK